MKILFSPFSPYVRKCLVAARELGLDDRIELLPSQAHPIDRDRTIIKDNPLGKVPTFFTDDGMVLYDSRVICEYLDDMADGPLFPVAGRPRWQALTLQSLGDGILDAALLARYEEAIRPEPLRWPEWKAGQLDKIETSLAALDADVARLAKAVPDIGTISVACALWYLDLRFADIGWRERHAALAGWYAGASRRESFAASWSLG